LPLLTQLQKKLSYLLGSKKIAKSANSVDVIRSSNNRVLPAMSSQSLPTNHVAQSSFSSCSSPIPQRQRVTAALLNHTFESYVNEGVRSDTSTIHTLSCSTQPAQSLSQPMPTQQPPFQSSRVNDASKAPSNIPALAVDSSSSSSNASARSQPAASLSLAQVCCTVTSLSRLLPFTATRAASVFFLSR
jgi:hypothetical protein